MIEAVAFGYHYLMHGTVFCSSSLYALLIVFHLYFKLPLHLAHTLPMDD